MEKRFLVIKNKETRQAIKKFVFNLCDYEYVNENKNLFMLDFCEINSLDYRNFFAEITK
jgi:hypothetical protein